MRVMQSTARLVTQEFSADLAPLEFYSLINQVGGRGLVLGTTLSIIGSYYEFMEGCFHLFTPHDAL
jgi:hypothetical protein